ncbi:hypothetical protein GCM10007907_20670 [Chitinimonas prasina]|uniref:DUF721 domain-containing protein n=1 Tax=Chitinimonas prasina TaxID=1434937 RepID=A0ABQ5YE67_9NEIS|nr:hypothetical protein GCM10007907_20670 [Chitinimonas prasina]
MRVPAIVRKAQQAKRVAPYETEGASVPNRDEDATGDIATIAHWPPDAVADIALTELAEWRERARVQRDRADRREVAATVPDALIPGTVWYPHTDKLHVHANIFQLTLKNSMFASYFNSIHTELLCRIGLKIQIQEALIVTQGVLRDSFY